MNRRQFLGRSVDRKTAFIRVQHPGEKGNSHFPDGGGSLPRSAVIAVQRDDGGLCGRQAGNLSRYPVTFLLRI